MRLNIRFVDRIGIFQEMLLVFAKRRLNVAAVEVDVPHIYVDVPALTAQRLTELREALALIDGVEAIFDVDMLPGTRRRLYLDALLAAMDSIVGAARSHLEGRYNNLIFFTMRYWSEINCCRCF